MKGGEAFVDAVRGLIRAVAPAMPGETATLPPAANPTCSGRIGP
tara:strand:+ start:26835 stop:26966 length:132 start_codon:yes stop_codon:yes gene_type:complete